MNGETRMLVEIL